MEWMSIYLLHVHVKPTGILYIEFVTCLIKPCMGLQLDELKSTKGQKFLFLNIRSIVANFSLLQLDFEYSPLMVLGLTETWLVKNTVTGLIKLKGLNICRLDRVKRMVIRAKRNYIATLLNKADTNPRKYWDELKKVFLTEKNDKVCKPEIILKDNDIVLPVSDTADVLNKHLAEIVANLA